MKRRELLGLLVLVVSFALLKVGLAETRYVSLSGGHVPPFTNWPTAARDIQAAINEASNGDTVLVSNGIYSSGGIVVSGSLKNRIAITNAITVRSVNGPMMTAIQGEEPSGDTAVRCVYMSSNAVLVGFTLFRGATRTQGDEEKDRSGGGIWSESANSMVSNCMVYGNSADYTGGGAFRGALYDCTFANNLAVKYGGGTVESMLYHCTLEDNGAGDSGGGAVGGILYNCALTHNVAENYGGGAAGSELYNCLLTGNSVAGAGGGAFRGKLYNCTVTGNSAIFGGGTYDSIHNNCIIYYNTAMYNANWLTESWHQEIFNYTCTTPKPDGVGNFADEPGIVSVDQPYLLANSPCVNAGTNQSWMESAKDIDGEPRVNGVADIGADEYGLGSLTGPLSISMSAAYTQAVVGMALPFVARITGRAQSMVWDFADGIRATNLFDVTHIFTTSGIFNVTVTASNLSGRTAVATTVRIVENATYYYVATNGNDLAAGTNWIAAKATIQSAIDAAIPGDTVWVDHGVYIAGGAANYPAGSRLTNRISIYKPITVRSVDGPFQTFIMGRGPAGDAAVRCVYLTEGARLDGFTLAGGHTRIEGDFYTEMCGGDFGAKQITP